MTVQVARQPRDFAELFKLERYAFAAKIRLARAVLGWSQSELGFRIGMTQRAIHKLEQGETEPRRTTMRALEEIWREHHIVFEDLADGGFASASVRKCWSSRLPRVRAGARLHGSTLALLR